MRQIVPIVEGHGELRAIPILVRRVLEAQGVRTGVQVLKAIRERRGTLLKHGGIERLAQAAQRKARGEARILVVLDADDDCAAALGPQLQGRLDRELGSRDGAAVLAVREYENWLIAHAAGLSRDGAFRDRIGEQRNPEAVRSAKRWLSTRTKPRRSSYDPVTDQARLTELVDIDIVRQKCPSFDKFWREVERLATA